jgi:hypothetical protein
MGLSGLVKKAGVFGTWRSVLGIDHLNRINGTVTVQYMIIFHISIASAVPVVTSTKRTAKSLVSRLRHKTQWSL